MTDKQIKEISKLFDGAFKSCDSEGDEVSLTDALVMCAYAIADLAKTIREN